MAPAGRLSTIAARLRAVGGILPVTPMTQSTCSRAARSTPMPSNGAGDPTWPTSKHSHLGRIASSSIASSSSTTSSKALANTAEKTNALRVDEYFA